jgi:hypothetical protein
MSALGGRVMVPYDDYLKVMYPPKAATRVHKMREKMESIVKIVANQGEEAYRRTMVNLAACEADALSAIPDGAIAPGVSAPSDAVIRPSAQEDREAMSILQAKRGRSASGQPSPSQLPPKAPQVQKVGTGQTTKANKAEESRSKAWTVYDM